MTGARFGLGTVPLRAWPLVVALLATHGQAAAQPDGDGRALGDRDAEPGEAAVSEEAREKFRAGVELTKAGKLDEALASFQEAYGLSSSYRILYNIGQVSKHMRDYAHSLRAFERYLADGGRKIDTGRRAEVQSEITSLRKQVGTLRIQVDPEGATVSIDEVKISEAPVAGAHYVNPGVHRLRAEAAGRAPASRDVEFAAGQTVDLVLSLGNVVAAAKPREARRPEAAGERRSTPVSRPIWVGWATTGALAAGAGVAGAFALASSSKLEDTPYEGLEPPAGSEVADLQDRVSTLATVADVLAAAAAVSLGVTLYFTLAAPSQAPAGGARSAQSVAVGLGAHGILLRGAF
jgi:hypothetical protein